jgi:ATP-dependent DNA helicase RecG
MVRTARSAVFAQAPLATQLRHVLAAAEANQASKELGLETVGDLLRHYPRRYSRRGEKAELGELVVGEYVTVVARVASVRSRYSDRKEKKKENEKPLHLLTLTLTDGRNRLECTFFNQHWLALRYPVGAEGMFTGKVTKFKTTYQLESPRAEVFDADVVDDEGKKVARLEAFAGGIVPIYPITGKLRMTTVQRWVQTALDWLPPIADPLPEVVLARHGLVDLESALHAIHRPPTEQALKHAEHRLRYDEALSVQLALAQRRARAAAFPARSSPPREDGLLSAFDARLPFTLTSGQREVSGVIARELSRPHPMNRLLQGEVGSGKTVVALRAMLQVVDAGRQAVLMAPTEVLAAQHARSLAVLLGPLGTAGQLDSPDVATRVTLLTGALPAAARREALRNIESGDAGIVVGTHALLGESVRYADLGLVVVDEQHRFGVEQRDQLRTKDPAASPPHVLVMTATPIPRTVAMTVYGDLETSVLRELPRGRSPIKTAVVAVSKNPEWLELAWRRVREAAAAGRQAYVVCPRISSDDDSDGGGVDGAGGGEERRPPLAATDMFAQLKSGPLKGLRLGLLHGRLTPGDKDDVMRAFQGGQIDVLVATTVVEVGVDVPNATLMIVMDAERFGISQLHQLRGRIGRGDAPGTCVLVTDLPPAAPGAQRLEIVASSTDGFELAKADLEQRREGDVLGRLQAGRTRSLKLLSLLRDEPLIVAAREDALGLIDSDPELAAQPGLREMVSSVLDERSQEFLEKS